MNAHKLSPTKHAITQAGVHTVPHTPGIYILYKANLGPPHYVGRSDRDLYETLVSKIGKTHYSYFKFMVCNTPDDAFQWECIYWHQGSKTLDNGEQNGGHHPRRPKDSHANCPVPGCTHSFEQSIPSAEEVEIEK